MMPPPTPVPNVSAAQLVSPFKLPSQFSARMLALPSLRTVTG